MTFLEIVQLSNGDIVVRQADGDGEPFVRIRFSDESRRYLGAARLDVARQMIQAGLKAINAIAGAPAADGAGEDSSDDDAAEEGIDVSADSQATVH